MTIKDNHVLCPICYGDKNVMTIHTEDEIDCPVCDEEGEVKVPDGMETDNFIRFLVAKYYYLCAV